MEARIMMFVVPGEQPDSTKTAETLAAITGGRVTVLETRPYIQQNHTGGTGILPGGGGGGGKKSVNVCLIICHKLEINFDKELKDILVSGVLS